MENGLKFVIFFIIAIVGMILVNIFGIKDPILSYWFGIISVVISFLVKKYLVPIFKKMKMISILV